jgi:hypothetical protein
MNNEQKQVQLNQAFLITNGIKTGKFIVFDQDRQVDFHVNAIYAASDLGRFFLSRKVDDSIFLLLTMENVYEGFWLLHIYDEGPKEQRDSETVIAYGADRTALPNRIDGHLDRGFIRLTSDSNSYWLSEMMPTFRDKSNYFTFATEWPAMEWDQRRNSKALSEETQKRMRELKQHLSTNMEQMREKAKMIPLSGAYNPSRRESRFKMVDLAEELARTASRNELGELEIRLGEARKFVSSYVSEFGDDLMTDFLSKRIEVLSQLV